VEGTCGRFHLKRYVYGGWRTSWGLVGRGTLWGIAPEIREFRALGWLRARGVGAARPLAAAATRRGGRLVAHALLTEDVEGAVDLAHALGGPVSDLRARPDRLAAVLRAVGASLRRAHDLGFAHRDCFARNVLVSDPEADPVGVWWIDCRRAAVRPWRRGPARDVATFVADLERLCDRESVEAFRAAYTSPRA
jgi:tRNA A-37 threonylcarbamoyl transferase component Bud32